MRRVRKTDEQRAMKDVFAHQAEHPWLTAALFAFLFPPAILLLVAVAKVLQRLFPEPQLWMIFFATPLLVLALVAGMLIGALLFLLVMKHFVDRTVLAPFYLYPGVPVTSDLSAKVFRWAYRSDKKSAKGVDRG